MNLETQMLRTAVLPSRNDVIRFSLLQAKLSGLILEFGVRTGTSLWVIAELVKPHPVWGFDSFKGLPEPWDKGPNVVEVGRMACEIPQVPLNVELVIGLFSKTLPAWLQRNKTPSIRFLHIDSDLYSSCHEVLFSLNHLLLPGSVILFDELSQFEDNQGVYTNWQNGEWKALNEWLVEKDRQVSFLCRDRKWRASVRVEK